MKHSMKTRMELGKPERKDFSSGRYFHKEKSPTYTVDMKGNIIQSKRVQEALKARQGMAYDSGNKIPAKRVEYGYRPQQR